MNIVGLDVGTTSLSAVALDAQSGAVLRALNAPNHFIESPHDWDRAQDADWIVQQLMQMFETLKQECGDIAAIGLTGQMHSMLYVDARGRAISPLYTWQNGCGKLPLEGGSYASVLSERSGHAMATGYGLTTHFWHAMNGCIPEGAAGICTIFDYAAMRLTGRSAPLMHISGAASMGMLDCAACGWDERAFAAAGLDMQLLPEVTPARAIVGETADGIPVACGIGDNQASFIGSVRDMENAVLVNMGTGGQISRMSNAPGGGDLESRPLGEGRSILVGSSLCGGRAYALLEGFIHSCAALAGYDGGALYEAMNQAGMNALSCGALPLVDPRFCGTRAQPELRASIANLAPENFSAGSLVGGTLLGMAQELFALYQQMQSPATAMVGSGNGLRKNPALRLAFEQAFGLPLSIPLHQEEAAYGAALFALSAAKGIPLKEAQQLIQYQ